MSHDLRSFIDQLEACGELKRITHPVDPYLEMTEICDRTLKQSGPALLFENPISFNMPVLANLFGTVKRVSLGMGQSNLKGLREVGQCLAALKEPEPPEGFKDVLSRIPLYKKALSMSSKWVKNAPCQAVVYSGDAVDLTQLPIQTCWPGDIAPLITWPLVITQGPHKRRHNIGIYRQQLLGKRKLIMRWLPQRGGALDFAEWKKAHPGKPFPLSVVLGTDPATLLAAVTPVPDNLSEYAFAGLLRNSRTVLTSCLTNDLPVPANAEIVLEGVIEPDELAEEGPFGDHTGYYNEVDRFPVFTVNCMTHRHQPIYHTTYTGKPPDEPSILGAALNEVLIPFLIKQFSEIVDFYLPPEGCSYRMAIVSIRKQYPGHARRIMLGVWSFLRQFMYTKWVVVVDDDINIRCWKDVIWAITTRLDPKQDMQFIESSPIDYLDFSSPISGLGSKIGLDATNKWPGETNRIWGTPLEMSPAVKQHIDEIWNQLNI